MVKTKLSIMSKPKIPSNLINVKFPNSSEIYETCRLFKKIIKWLKNS